MDLVFDLTWRQAFTASAAMVGIGSALQSAELLAIRREFAPNGLLGWPVLRTAHGGLLRSPVVPFVDWLLSPPAYLAVLAVQFVSALVIVARAADPPIWALCAVLAARALFNFRNAQTIIGADQVQWLVLAACLVWALAPDSAAERAAGWFVCLQLIIGYVTAGIYKWTSRDWRDGSAIHNVVRTRAMGLEHAYHLLQRFSRLSLIACWATIVFECLFPWLVFGGGAACLVFLAAGLIFHLGVAIVMGFDEFVWAYLASYPMAYRCALDIQQWWT